MSNEFNSAPIKIVDRLKNVVYDPNERYIPSDFALRFVNFIKLVNGGEEENKTPVIHMRMLDLVDTGETNIANMLFRGAAKTTVFAEYMCLYLATYGELPHLGEVDFAIYVGDTVDNGVKNFRLNVEHRWENSSFLQKVVPRADFTMERFEFENEDGFVFSMYCYGAKTGVRGTKAKGKRPQLAILDDLLGDDQAISPAEIRSIETTVFNAVDYALHPTRRMIIWSGTPFNEGDPLYKAMESGAWASNVFPVCEKFPCSEEEFRSAWPDRFTYKYVRSQYEKAVLQNKLPSFYQELMLRITSDEQMLVNDSHFQPYSKYTLLAFRDRFNFYITTDFAVSEKQHADFSVITVFAVNSKGHYFIVDGWRDKQPMNIVIDELFRLVRLYNPLSVGIEISGQQAGFIPWLRERMILSDTFFTLAGDGNTAGLRPIGGKLERFNVFLPTILEYKFHLPIEDAELEYVKAIKHEIGMVTKEGIKSKTDDSLDTISMIPRMNVVFPSPEEETEPEEPEIVYNTIWGDAEEDMYNANFTDGISSYLV